MSAARPKDRTAGVESGEIVASFSSLAEAQQAVRSLTEAEIPANRLTLLRHDPAGAALGRRPLPGLRLAEAGLVGGALGAMILLLAGIVGISGTAASELTVATFLLGVVCGALAGTIAVLVAGAEPIEADARYDPTRYDLAVDPRVSERAMAALRLDARRERARHGS
jgi:hypothetical protein